MRFKLKKPSRRLRNKPAPPGKRLLGLDLGERRIGVAISDPAGILASPLRTIDLHREDLSTIAMMAAEHQVEGVIIGLPVTMAGSEGFQAERVRTMAEELEDLLPVPIVFWDERLTSAMADQLLENRTRRSRAKGIRDAYAAAIMLQSYLDTEVRAWQA